MCVRGWEGTGGEGWGRGDAMGRVGRGRDGMGGEGREGWVRRKGEGRV